jgi:hypothetical protein
MIHTLFSHLHLLLAHELHLYLHVMNMERAIRVQTESCTHLHARMEARFRFEKHRCRLFMIRTLFSHSHPLLAHELHLYLHLTDMERAIPSVKRKALRLPERAYGSSI